MMKNQKGTVPLMVILTALLAIIIGAVIVVQRNSFNLTTKIVKSSPSPSSSPKHTPTSFPTLTPKPSPVSSQPTPTPTPVPTPIPTSGSAHIDIPILVLNYFPLDSTSQHLDATETETGMALTDMRSYVASLVQQGMNQLSAGGKYHGYKNTSVAALFGFRVVDTKEFLSKLPRLNSAATSQNPSQPDYRQILNNVNICNYVDNLGVRQVWLFGYHHGSIYPVESDMSMGRLSQSYWNFGTYGDVSNSYKIDDMPICNHTYVLFNYNYTRGVAELVEDHNHQIEAVMSFVDGTLWNSFVNPYGRTDIVNHCGWTHYPPNGASGYDWRNERTVSSNCEDWHPDGSGTVKSYSCHTVYGTTCSDDTGLKFKVWWMQNIPGINNGLIHQGKQLRSWLEFYADFDGAIAKGKSL